MKCLSFGSAHRAVSTGCLLVPAASEQVNFSCALQHTRSENSPPEPATIARSHRSHPGPSANSWPNCGKTVDGLWKTFKVLHRKRTLHPAFQVAMAIGTAHCYVAREYIVAVFAGSPVRTGRGICRVTSGPLQGLRRRLLPVVRLSGLPHCGFAAQASSRCAAPVTKCQFVVWTFKRPRTER